MRKIKYMLLTILLCFFVSQTVFANDAIFGQVLADMYLSKTNADIALVFEDDIINPKSNSVICVYEISGDKIYSKIEKLINETKKDIYISGASVDIKSTIGNGRQKSIEKITIKDSVLSDKNIYTLALNHKYNSFFEGENNVATYTSNDALLYEYMNTFSTYEQSAEETSSDDENNASDIILRQSSTLVMALMVLLIAIVVYFILKKKQN